MDPRQSGPEAGLKRIGSWRMTYYFWVLTQDQLDLGPDAELLGPDAGP